MIKMFKGGDTVPLLCDILYPREKDVIADKYRLYKNILLFCIPIVIFKCIYLTCLSVIKIYIFCLR